MLVDLDAPIYVVPCGVPGDLDALSGRAHSCDRMRIAVTLCEPCVADYCVWGEGIEICECVWPGYGDSYRGIADLAGINVSKLPLVVYVPGTWVGPDQPVTLLTWRYPNTDCSGPPDDIGSTEYRWQFLPDFPFPGQAYLSCGEFPEFFEAHFPMSEIGEWHDNEAFCSGGYFGFGGRARVVEGI